MFYVTVKVRLPFMLFLSFFWTERRLVMLENEVLRKMFKPNEYQVREGWRKLQL
jgi:hypothetical protein